MHLSVTIPEELVNRLRAGALDVVLAPIREPAGRAQQGIRSPRFKRASALLDVIGWQAGEAGEEVVIDMVEHAPALYDALDYALGHALRDLRETEGGEGYTCASAAGLCGYAAVIEDEDLVRARNDPRVRCFRDEADALMAELDREAAEHARRARRPARSLARLRRRLAGLSGLSTCAQRSGRLVGYLGLDARVRQSGSTPGTSRTDLQAGLLSRTPRARGGCVGSDQDTRAAARFLSAH